MDGCPCAQEKRVDLYVAQRVCAPQPIGSALQEAWDAWEIYLRKLHEAR